jgi:hypothetical protein
VEGLPQPLLNVGSIMACDADVSESSYNRSFNGKPQASARPVRRRRFPGPADACGLPLNDPVTSEWLQLWPTAATFATWLPAPSMAPS